MTSWKRHLSPLAVSLLVAACGSGRPEPPPAGQPAPVATPSTPPPADTVAPDECIVPGGMPAEVPVTRDSARDTAPDTVVVVSGGPVDPAHAPVPTTEAERLVFRQRYETLVRVDCTGRLRPALAERWTVDSSGRVWTFFLRDARLGDGTPVTAASILAAWRAQGTAAHWSAAGIRTADAVAEHELAVAFTDSAAPAVLADPVFAVPAPLALAASTADGADRAVLDFRDVPGADPRDLLDGGADLLVTRDPAVLVYAAGRPDLVVAPLGWDRAYVLVVPNGAEHGAARDTARDTALAFRRALARDAVRAEARAAEGPFWWDRGICRTGPRPASPTRSLRIVYPAGDRTARELAERLVALARNEAGGSGSAPRTAAALAPRELATALAAGSEAGYVLPLPRTAPLGCDAVPLWPGDARVTPLVETRAHAVLRRGAVRITADADGGIRILAP